MNLTIVGIVAVIVVGGVLYVLRRSELRRSEALGRAEAEREEVEREKRILARQAEILLEDVEVEDVARDLDSGKF